jgi:hypothetical protein
MCIPDCMMELTWKSCLMLNPSQDKFVRAEICKVELTTKEAPMLPLPIFNRRKHIGFDHGTNKPLEFLVGSLWSDHHWLYFRHRREQTEHAQSSGQMGILRHGGCIVYLFATVWPLEKRLKQMTSDLDLATCMPTETGSPRPKSTAATKETVAEGDAP